MRIFITDNDKRLVAVKNRLSTWGIAAELFDGKYVEKPPYFLIAPPSSPADVIMTLIDIMPADSVLIGGVSDIHVDEYAKERGIYYINIMKDETFATANAVATAEGALAVLIENTVNTVHGMNIAVSGIGRIGKRLCTLLNGMGAHVYPICSDSVEAAWAQSAWTFNNMTELLPLCAALINTVPQRVFDKSALSKMPAGAVFIDVASAPRGVCSSDVEDLGLTYITAPGLPGRFSPESAADYLANAIYKKISEVEI